MSTLFLAPPANPYNVTATEKRLLDAFRSMDVDCAIAAMAVFLKWAEENPAYYPPKLRLVESRPVRVRRSK
jgi:hypothetical protein